MTAAFVIRISAIKLNLAAKSAALEIMKALKRWKIILTCCISDFLICQTAQGQTFCKWVNLFNHVSTFASSLVPFKPENELFWEQRVFNVTSLLEFSKNSLFFAFLEMHVGRNQLADSCVKSFLLKIKFSLV